VNGLSPRLQQVALQIPHGATVLDVGCSNGVLLAWLRDNRGVDGRGIELDGARVAAAVGLGLSVVQGDADRDLAAFPDQSVDYAILSETLQAMHAPARVLAELLRIGRRAVVAFPNFGHWRVRLDLLTKGRMPVTRNLPTSWHDTENIHLCTVKDFKALAAENCHVIEREAYLQGDRPISRLPNLCAEHALFVLRN
jgi:methionine biosynthesis protein MetW